MIPLKVNADYEVELFHKQLAPVAINQTIEFFLFFLAGNPLFTQKKYSTDYLAHVERITGHRPQTVSAGKYENFWGPLNDLISEKWWNSKLTSTQFIIDQGWCSETHILRQDSDLDNITWNRPYLLKDPFAMSGQKFTLLKENSKDLILSKLKSGPLIIEPYFERRYDFSQYVFPNGEVIRYENQVDHKFQYKGSTFNENLSFEHLVSKQNWDQLNLQTKAIIDFYSQKPNLAGYSIDSFVYLEDNELKIRAMSEVNYRRTMGRVTYELAQKYAPQSSWSKLILAKISPLEKNLWDLFEPLKNVIVLSPGDSRFDIFFLHAKNKDEGSELIKKMNDLLTNAKSSVTL